MFYDFPYMWNADLMWSSIKTTAQNTHESNFSCQKPKIIHLEWAHLVFHLLTVDDEILHNWPFKKIVLFLGVPGSKLFLLQLYAPFEEHWAEYVSFWKVMTEKHIHGSIFWSVM